MSPGELGVVSITICPLPTEATTLASKSLWSSKKANSEMCAELKEKDLVAPAFAPAVNERSVDLVSLKVNVLALCFDSFLCRGLGNAR